jgi:hypothetical protein
MQSELAERTLTMVVQLSIPFETLVSLVEQLPADQKQPLIERVKTPSYSSMN